MKDYSLSLKILQQLFQIMQILHLKIVLLICFFITPNSPLLVESFSIKDETNPINTQLSNNLGFSNYTGSNVTDEQIQGFINFVNTASEFYRDSTSARLQYITDKMWNTFSGITNVRYQVIEVDFETDTKWANATSLQNFASFSPGINRIFPTKSYLFWRRQVRTSNLKYILSVGQSYGMTQKYETIIKGAIFAVENTNECTCRGSNVIADLLKYSDGESWNVFCSGYELFKAAVFSITYTYTRPQHCYYLIYKL